MNGMRAIDCAFRALAQMLPRYLQKEQQLQNNMRDVPMPASIQSII
jgi:hypothetical protein